MSEELLTKVDLFRLSGPAREDLWAILREVLAEEGCRKAGALRATEAAAYIGVSRSRFYELLKEDQSLEAIAVSMGEIRVWPTADLDRWLQDRRVRLGPAKAREAA